MWQTVVLITKGKEEFRGIGLAEVLWESIASLLNRRLTSAISFHDTLHGFWAGHGTGNAALEAKIHQQLMAMGEVVLFKVFRDLRKAYDALYRKRSLYFLAAYGVGPRTV